MEVRIQDEALFVVPGSGALWSFDFGRIKRVIRETAAEASDPPYKIAQVRAGDSSLLLAFPILGRAASIAEQDRIRTILHEHVGNPRVAFILAQSFSHVALVGSERELVEHFAAAAAVVRACWAWDESRVISVVVDEFEFTVAPSFDGEVWTASPELVSRARARARL